ncbi:MAG: outer membrane beta-barrel protein [Saprospiraceae bacterium]|nr:outer membrane beta-barrel protein [Saprospiraceae bacterium]
MRQIKIFASIVFFLAFISGASAQLRLGAGMGFGFDVEEFSAFVRGAYDFTDQWRANATFNYYFIGEDDGTSIDLNLFDINLDGHFTFAQPATIDVYAIGGLNIGISSVDAPIVGKSSDTEIGLNLGAGANFGVADNADIVTEFKYTIGGFDQLFFAAGVLFKFGGN